jgi:hypothetical protein
MTISIAWTRRAGKHDELVFASDSRLRSFGSWDANPKIFQLERTDCAISFAGNTHYSYPLINQIQTFVKSYPKSQARFQDICQFKGHLLNMMNFMLKHKSDFEFPQVRFLFGGYSWDRGRFYLWHIFFDKHQKLFVSPEVRTWKGIKKSRLISQIGDYRIEFREKLIDLMVARKKFVNGYFDMEPFEVLRDMIREKKFDRIGGPPQLLKVYTHMNRCPIAVKWAIDNKPMSTMLGRPLQDYESNIYPEIDPDSLFIERGQVYG